MVPRMTIQGGTELSAALRSLSGRVSRSLMREALEEGAEPIRARMAQLAPHDPGPPDIRANIVTSTARGGGGFQAGDVAVAVGPAQGFFYGHFQEFGTEHHSAQPFIRPAFDSEGRRAVDVIGAALWRDLAGRGVHRPTVDRTGGPLMGGPGGGLL